MRSIIIPWFVSMMLVGSLRGDAPQDPLMKCLSDPDYDHLMDIMDHGLPPTRKPRHIVVVGAGMSGLTAAKLLQDAGHQITIIEAQDEFGGRVRTYRDKDEGWYAELGAMRIPSFHKILITLLKKIDVKLNKFIQSCDNTYYLLNGQRYRTYAVRTNPDLLNYTVYDWEKGRSAAELFSLALEPMRHFLKQSRGNCTEMMAKYDVYSVEEYLREVGNLSRGALHMIGDILNDNSFFYTAITENIYIQADVNDNVTYSEVTGGFDNLIKSFYKGLNCSIVLRSQVTKIRQSNHGVKVTFSKNNGDVDSLTADYVLVTTTAKAVLLMDFVPPLSGLKLEALRSLHYSSSSKVLLAFRERFWEKEQILGGKSITDRLSRFIYYPSHKFPGQGGALLGSYTFSDDAKVFETMEEDEVINLVLEDLVQLHGEHIRSLFHYGLVKHWGLDRYSHGAFAIFTPFQKTFYARELFRNEHRVHFAGEHTATPHGWIETAIKSALRAAENIHNLKD